MSYNNRSTFYVYVDWTRENYPRPFYVGKGNANRIKVLGRNNKHTWVQKQFGIDRRIMCSTISEQFAFDLEVQLIVDNDTFNPNFKDYSDIRCNLTKGGEGASGYHFSEEQRDKIKSYHNRLDVKIRKSLIQKVIQNRQDVKKNKGEIFREKWKSDEFRTKMLIVVRNHRHSQSVRQRIAESIKHSWDIVDKTKRCDNIRTKTLEAMQRNEVKVKMSLGMKNCWENQEYRDKRRESLKKYFETQPEAIENLRKEMTGKKRKCKICGEFGHYPKTCKLRTSNV